MSKVVSCIISFLAEDRRDALDFIPRHIQEEYKRELDSLDWGMTNCFNCGMIWEEVQEERERFEEEGGILPPPNTGGCDPDRHLNLLEAKWSVILEWDDFKDLVYSFDPCNSMGMLGALAPELVNGEKRICTVIHHLPAIAFQGVDSSSSIDVFACPLQPFYHDENNARWDVPRELWNEWVEDLGLDDEFFCEEDKDTDA